MNYQQCKHNLFQISAEEKNIARLSTFCVFCRLGKMSADSSRIESVSATHDTTQKSQAKSYANLTDHLNAQKVGFSILMPKI